MFNHVNEFIRAFSFLPKKWIISIINTAETQNNPNGVRTSAAAPILRSRVGPQVRNMQEDQEMPQQRTQHEKPQETDPHNSQVMSLQQTLLDTYNGPLKKTMIYPKRTSEKLNTAHIGMVLETGCTKNGFVFDLIVIVPKSKLRWNSIPSTTTIYFLTLPRKRYKKKIETNS